MVIPPQLIPTESTTSIFSAPFTFLPKEPHTHTIIFLHGRGDNSKNFATVFGTMSPSSTSPSLVALYPSTKFVFPTVEKGFSHIFKCNMTQWFDGYYTHDEVHYSDLTTASLRGVVEYVHEVIRAEVEVGVPPERILLGGISQGCASAVLAFLTGKWRLGGLVGICGWMPFVKSLQEVAGRAGSVEAVQELAGKLGMSAEGEEVINGMLGTPVWLGHAHDDQVVLYDEGRKIFDGTSALKMDVTWQSYNECGHWYKVPEEIDDIVDFCESKCGFPPKMS